MSALIKVTIKQAYHSEDCDMVFHYFTPTSVGNVCHTFDNYVSSTLVPAINAIQNSQVLNISASLVNVLNPLDYSNVLFTGNGDVGDNNSGMPKFLALKFDYQLAPSTIKRGFKRIVGVDRSQIAFADIADTSYGAMDACGAVLSAVADMGGFQLAPVVARYSGAMPIVTYQTAQIVAARCRHTTSQNTRKR